MMKINVTQAKKEIGSRNMFKFVTSAEQLGIGDEHQWADNVVTIEGELVNTGRLLEVSGTIHTVAHYQCDRCLDDFHTNVEIPFFEQFQESEMSETNNEDEIVYFQGDEIDISELVRESILLAQPINTVCSEDCRGLCIKCGSNLNRSDCSCDRHIVDPRLAELQKFFNKD
ncbi:hypothetical protein SDC9_183827 [bioreactor metagenome]|uniref:Large ribosomal RNA subunit accumulation protein YceD n=1 Tax=bioreactor metagenome TaxID=1076179 RepID=A0A645HBB0_9ZZZZ